MGLAVRHSCAAQLGDRAAGWREAKAAPRDRGVPGEHRNRRAAEGLRVHRRTRRQRAHGRDTQEPSAGDSNGPLETSGETEWGQGLLYDNHSIDPPQTPEKATH